MSFQNEMVKLLSGQQHEQRDEFKLHVESLA